MKYDGAQPCIAALVMFRSDNKIAMLLRQKTNWMNGLYGLPAGKVEPGESFTQAAIREAKEEVGVDISPPHLKHLLTVYRTSMVDKRGLPWIDIIFEAVSWQGELYNAEPDKHGELKWFDFDNLPKNITPFIPFYRQQIIAGNRYAEYGWEE